MEKVPMNGPLEWPLNQATKGPIKVPVKLKITQPRKLDLLTKRDFELRIRDIKSSGEFRNVSASFDRRDTRWNPDTIFALKNQFQNGDKARSKKDPLALRVGFDGGGEFRLLLLPETRKLVDCQSALRRQLQEVLKSKSARTVRVDVADLLPDLQRKLLSWIGSLIVLAPFHSSTFSKKVKKAPVPSPLSVVVVTDVESTLASEILRAGALSGAATNLVRHLADLPGNHLRPKQYTQLIAKRARGRGFRYELLDRLRLERLGAGAFLAVAQGSERDQGGLVHLTYRPRTKKVAPKLVLVGKGLCFDTGGYNIKTGPHMYSMHRDMTGSAVALGLFEMCVNLKVPFEVHALLAVAENVIAPNAFRPNDVVTALDGTTIEVVDTDAEGRMVLADSLAFAKRLKPDLTLDFATLTGAAVRAVGTQRSAVFSNRRELLELACEAGEASGERVWSFPIGDEYADQLKSDIADILQCTTFPGPDHIHAATFLSKFISDDVPWLHCDLSAESNKGGIGLVSSETTGFGIRWGMEVIQKFFRVRYTY